MACNLLSRLFRRRERRLPVLADRCSPPALPAHSDKLELHRSLEQLELLDPIIEEHDYNFLLGCLSEQGSCTLTLSDVAFGTDNVNLHQLRSLPGFIGFEGGASETPAVDVDVLVHFSTAADASSAMATQPTITIGDGTSRRLEILEGSSDIVEPSAKRQKTEPVSAPLPKCIVCCEEIDGPHAKPCFYCEARWCHDCLKGNIATALNDQERFPAKCCGRIVHFDVARGIVTDSDYSRYRTRFEEHSTTRPVYCADPTCSQFLPTRLAAPYEKSLVRCFTCQQITCGECRVLVDSTKALFHQCTVADEMTALMKQFEYKRCPRCSTGVAKMFGCSHVRCQCGAHWCWDCQRAIQICWSKPCARAREDGDITDDYDAPDEDSDSEEETTSETLPAHTAQHTTAVFPSIEEALEGMAVPNNDASVEASTDADPSTETLSVDPVADIADESNTAATSEVSQNPGRNNSVDEIESTLGPLVEAPVAQLHGTTVDVAPVQAAVPLEYRPPACLAPPLPRAPTPAPAPESNGEFSELINLDAEDFDEWEAGSYDFGDEPIDETWDTWGCLHHFTPVHSAAIHEHWLPTTVDQPISQATKHIDCLRCYKTINLTDMMSQREEEDARKDSAVDISSTNLEPPDETPPAQIAPDTGIQADKKGKKVRKGKNRTDVPKLFNCPNCGVFYCGDCKKTTMKELNTALGRTLIRT